MRKNSLTILFGIILILSIVFCYTLYTRSNSKLGERQKTVDSLSKSLTQSQYNYGLSLAKIHCMTCHRFNFATDNYLEGVVQRVGERYLSLYLTKQDSLISIKDPYAIAIKEKYGNLGNSHNFKFSKSEVDAIINFMK